jgi:hypothetical protein
MFCGEQGAAHAPMRYAAFGQGDQYRYCQKSDAGTPADVVVAYFGVSCSTRSREGISGTLSEPIGMVVPKPMHQNLRARSDPTR